jgi:hypothetical protein
MNAALPLAVAVTGKISAIAITLDIEAGER